MNRPLITQQLQKGDKLIFNNRGRVKEGYFISQTLRRQDPRTEKLLVSTNSALYKKEAWKTIERKNIIEVLNKESNGVNFSKFTSLRLKPRNVKDFDVVNGKREIKTWTGGYSTIVDKIANFLRNRNISEQDKLKNMKLFMKSFTVSDLLKFHMLAKYRNIRNVESVKNLIKNNLKNKYKNNPAAVLQLHNGGGRFRYGGIWNDVVASGLFNENQLNVIVTQRQIQKMMPAVYKKRMSRRLAQNAKKTLQEGIVRKSVAKNALSKTKLPVNIASVIVNKAKVLKPKTRSSKTI